MKANKIDVTVEPFQQPANLFGMCRRVVNAAKDNIFKRQASLMREVVLAE